MTERLKSGFFSASCKGFGHFGMEKELLGRGEKHSYRLHKLRADFVEGGFTVFLCGSREEPEQ